MISDGSTKNGRAAGSETDGRRRGRKKMERQHVVAAQQRVRRLVGHRC